MRLGGGGGEAHAVDSSGCVATALYSEDVMGAEENLGAVAEADCRLRLDRLETIERQQLASMMPWLPSLVEIISTS